MITGTVPPSAPQAAPVTYDERGEQRNAITAAISSGSAIRFSGRPAATAASTSSRLRSESAAVWSARPPIPSQADDRVGPGATALQRMPSSAWTSATSRDRDSTAALVTEYSGMPLLGRLPEVDATHTIAAAEDARRCGRAALMQRT